MLQRLGRVKSSFLLWWRGYRVQVAVAVTAIVCGSLDIGPTAGRTRFQGQVVIDWEFYK